MSASDSENATTESREKPELNKEEREQIVQSLLKRFDSDKNKLEHGAVNETATAFDVHRSTVSRIWSRAKEFFEKDSVYKAPSLKAENCGQKAKDLTEPLSKIKEVPLNRRSTLRSLAHEVGVPKSTLFDRFKAGALKRVTSAIKPTLTDENRKARVIFCRSFVQPDGYFDSMTRSSVSVCPLLIVTGAYSFSYS